MDKGLVPVSVSIRQFLAIGSRIRRATNSMSIYIRILAMAFPSSFLLPSWLYYHRTYEKGMYLQSEGKDNLFINVGMVIGATREL